MSSMMTMPALPMPQAAKPRKRAAAKAAKPEDAAKVKATIHISEKAAKLLGVYAVMTDSSNSGVVESLILEHLRRFVVSDRAKVDSADRAMVDVSAD